MPLERSAAQLLNNTGSKSNSEQNDMELINETVEQDADIIQEQHNEIVSETEKKVNDSKNFIEQILELLNAQHEKQSLLIEGFIKKTEESINNQNELEGKVIQTLKENANFQIQVRQNMQREIEGYKKKASEEIFIPILKELAELYIEWQDVLSDMEDGLAKRKVIGIFEYIREILEEKGCDFGFSEIGTKRKTRFSKLKDKVFTADKSKHETVARSHNPWIVKEPFIIYPEYVDVYVYNADLEMTKTASDMQCDAAKENNIINNEEVL